MKYRTKGFSWVLNRNLKLNFPYNEPYLPPPLPPCGGGGRAKSWNFCFYYILMKFETKRFLRVLNMNPKLISPYDAPYEGNLKIFAFIICWWNSGLWGCQGSWAWIWSYFRCMTLSSPTPHLGAGAKSKFLLSSYFDGIWNKAFARVLNINPELILPYYLLPSTPCWGAGQNI